MATSRRLMPAQYGLCICLYLLGAPPIFEAAKILIIPFGSKSHLIEGVSIGSGLLRQGHDVYLMMDKAAKLPNGLIHQDIKKIYFEPENTDPERVERKNGRTMFTGHSENTASVIGVLRERINAYCKGLIYNTELITKLQEKKFDIAVVDGLTHCLFLVPYKLGIPYIGWTNFVRPWDLRLHPIITSFPCKMRSETNTLLTRMMQFGISVITHTLPNELYDEELFKDVVPERPYTSVVDVALHSKLWLLNTDNILDCPRPSLPNIIYVGGLNVRPGRRLPEDIYDFVEKAPDGTILVSFGSMMVTPPVEVIRKFVETFAMLEHNVIWRLKLPDNVTIKFPKNVKIVDWLPQNDILASRNVRLFITHCGNNGQSEAIYHGVPMLGFPLHSQQPYNGKRMEVKGYGLKMNIRSFTAKEMHDKIKEIISNEQFYKTIHKASAIFQSRPHPQDLAAYWIDHVIKFGADHLQTSANDMSAFQFTMFDIFAVLVLVVILLLIGLKFMVSYLMDKLWPDLNVIKDKLDNMDLEWKKSS
ncbi:2-hydroxyacylsphingosine 1-beta-galactosyltransferase-like [Lineus longissimus]|uniref:2-hydroxyacylsphingosine 1-beta-galactosyltransferase-like n=1 Tax=Lineus longissimus TaxID=88925 RepID=UPI00315CFD85